MCDTGESLRLEHLWFLDTCNRWLKGLYSQPIDRRFPVYEWRNQQVSGLRGLISESHLSALLIRVLFWFANTSSSLVHMLITSLNCLKTSQLTNFFFFGEERLTIINCWPYSLQRRNSPQGTMMSQKWHRSIQLQHRTQQIVTAAMIFLCSYWSTDQLCGWQVKTVRYYFNHDYLKTLNTGAILCFVIVQIRTDESFNTLIRFFGNSCQELLFIDSSLERQGWFEVTGKLNSFIH